MAEPLNSTPGNTNAGQIAIDPGVGDNNSAEPSNSFVPTEELIGGEKAPDPSKPVFSLDDFTKEPEAVAEGHSPLKAQRIKLEEVKKDSNDPEDDTLEEAGEDKEPAAEGDDKTEDVDPIKDKAVVKNDKIHGNTTRDYTGFNANQIKLLKKLDTPRFEKIGAEWKALNEASGKAVALAVELEAQKKLLAEGGIPNQWYEHPEAYQLSKEFRDLSSAYSRQEAVEQFYEQQLLNNKSGQNFFVIQGWDQAGNPIYSAAQQASNQGDIFLTRELAKTTQLKANLEDRSEILRSTYQQQHKQAAQSVQSEVQGFIDKLDKDLKFEDKDVEVVINALPKMYRDHPLAKCFAQVVALNFSQGRYINKTKGERAQQVKLDADKKLAGPRASKIPAQPSANKLGNRKDTLSLDDFLRED